MPIPSEITALVDRLNQELNQIEQEATGGVNLVRSLLFRFPDNAILTQYFAYFNSALFFIETSRRQIQTSMEAISISPTDVPNEVIQEVGEDLAALLGLLLEVKLKVEQLMARLLE